MIDLDELEKLEKEATPGPWEWRAGEEYEIHAKAQEEYPKHWGDSDDDGNPLTVKVVESDGGYYGPIDEDGRLIVALRNALPEMIKELRYLRQTVETCAWDYI